MARRGRSWRSRASTPGCRATPTSSRSCPRRVGRRARSARRAASTSVLVVHAGARRPDPRPARGHRRRRGDGRVRSRRSVRAPTSSLARLRRAHGRTRRTALPDDDRAAAVAGRTLARCSARPTGVTSSRTRSARRRRRHVPRRPGARRRAHRRADRHVRVHARRGAGEPLLPLPRDRRRDRATGTCRSAAWVPSQGALEDAARAWRARPAHAATVTHVDPGGPRTARPRSPGPTTTASSTAPAPTFVLAACAPAVLDRLLGNERRASPRPRAHSSRSTWC